MLEAVRGDGCALQFASDELRADPEERVSPQSRWRVFTVKGGVVGGVFFVWVRPWEVRVMLVFLGVGGWFQCWFIGFY